MTSLRRPGERNFNAASRKPTCALIQSVFEAIAALYKLSSDKSSGNCEEELPEKLVGQLSANCRSTVGQLSVDCRPTDGRQSAVCRSTVGQQTGDSRPTGFPLNTDYQSADSWPTDDQQSADSW